ncbi:MAG: DNA-directed RNA polymerase subunit omega [Dialister sp.]|nr:DNA-directed RNA polymerase subunit omega [Dialister sp.]
MMCYPSIDALVKKVDTKYTLVTLAAMRARELTDGALPLLDDDGKKTVTLALEEIYKDKITYSEEKK